MAPAITRDCLQRENREFEGTCGVSHGNQAHGFAPAFMDSASGRTEIARYADGRPAPMHLLDGVPGDWVLGRDAEGQVIAIKPTVISGFLRDGRFYTREQAAALRL